MKKTILTLIVIASLTVAGCDSKPKIEAPSAPAPQAQAPAPSQPAAGSDPHAGMNMKAQEIPAGSGVKAKVAQTMNSGGYTYVEAVDDKGQKVWLALPQIKVAVGDAIEYPANTMAMTNFTSKTLNKTFDKIFFVPGIRIVK